MNIRCYDNGGRSIDRYTVVFMDWPEVRPGVFAALAMNVAPFHPQGFGQHCTARPGRHLGRRVQLADLPEDCQKLVRMDLAMEEETI